MPPLEQFTNRNKRPFSLLTTTATANTAVAYQSVPPPVASSSSSSPSTSFTDVTPQNQSQSLHYPPGQQPLYNSNNNMNNPATSNTTMGNSSNNNNTNGSNLSEKKLRRLEKNRLSARECRRRKREATEDMEQEIFRLEAENLKLRLQLRVSIDRNHVVRNCAASMERMLRSGFLNCCET
jgi:hypothetical protein